MSGTIKKIDVIKNLAVFQDFKWDLSVRDKGKNVAEFKKINIFYGRNYSGKTTLSRIFRALETGKLSEKYDSPEFQVVLENGETVTQAQLTEHGQTIRVFNEDFVKDNLRFIYDESSDIESFAILGSDNAKLQEEIGQYEIELGSEEEKTGLKGELVEATEHYKNAQKAHSDKSNNLNKKLTDKARNIKENATVFQKIIYNIKDINSDVKVVNSPNYATLEQELIDQHRSTLKEEPKQTLPECEIFDLSFSSLSKQAEELIEKKIQTSDPIQDLLNDALLDKWVRDGLEYHQGKRSTCAFCGSDLPEGLWKKLGNHFNKESEELRIQIEQLITEIEAERARIPDLLTIITADFYSNFHTELESVRESLAIESAAYIKTLDELTSQLEQRNAHIFSPLQFNAPKSTKEGLLSIRGKYDRIRKQSNDFTNGLSKTQSEARATLRLHEVFTFINNIKYQDECDAIAELKTGEDEAKGTMKEASVAVHVKQTQIDTLESQLKDEGEGAKKVNEYLNSFFGHESLSLKPIENTDNETDKKYRFEVTRDGRKASQLSEGECSLIAFCYFMAKLKDHETDNLKPIIWIDDPISSLDANHVFFIYSLINAEIVKAKQFRQLFISTHNLDFLKYLKRISTDYKGKGDNRVQIREFFHIERRDQFSVISLMPDYLKRYVTEFNYLFHQIYRCATEEQNDTNHHVFCNFGNNARKFLEIFLYYKYPTGIENDGKLEKFFGENIPALLTDRINNEYSHMSGVFERGASPVIVPEMKSSAKSIISKIQKDYDQYESLLKSINVNPENDPLRGDNS